MLPPDVHHLALEVADLERAERFYAGVLGLPVLTRHVDDAGRPRAVWLSLGGAGAFLALERAPEGARARQDGEPGWHCVALRIAQEDRTRWVQKLAAAGHPVVRRTTFTIYARDPDGALLGLSHHPVPADSSAHEEPSSPKA